mmetsp:Transcript_13339/g.18385  ORF Transcript_13339/g.18385 Transcript_13339/m.18385 type:complete len:229 (-) Transcript_13339:50-736(-)
MSTLPERPFNSTMFSSSSFGFLRLYLTTAPAAKHTAAAPTTTPTTIGTVFDLFAEGLSESALGVAVDEAVPDDEGEPEEGDGVAEIEVDGVMLELGVTEGELDVLAKGVGVTDIVGVLEGVTDTEGLSDGVMDEEGVTDGVMEVVEDGDGLIDGLLVGESPGVGVLVGETEMLGVTLGETDILGVLVGDTDILGVLVGDTEILGVLLGVTEGEGVGRTTENGLEIPSS